MFNQITGRRKELLLSSTLYLIGALITALAPNFVVMVIGRLIYGIGIGLVSHLFIYMSDICSPASIHSSCITSIMLLVLN